MRTVAMFLTLFLPWPLRRRVLCRMWGYELHPSSKIGLAWVFPRKLVMEANTSIGHLTVCKGLDLLHLKDHATIGRGNWISGFPSGSTVHFTHQPERAPTLVVGEHSAITHRHLIDCTNSVSVGRYTTFAGYQSQILTHSIDVEANRQSSQPIVIGDYCFVGTKSVLLGGSILPDYSVLGAQSLLNKPQDKKYYLYAGTPARPVKELSQECGYFSRKVGFVK